MSKTSQGLEAALRAQGRGRKGQPTDCDRPPPSTFGGKKTKLISGQLDLDGVQHGAQPEGAETDAA
jgi:hypothetical protein